MKRIIIFYYVIMFLIIFITMMGLTEVLSIYIPNSIMALTLSFLIIGIIISLSSIIFYPIINNTKEVNQK